MIQISTLDCSSGQRNIRLNFSVFFWVRILSKVMTNGRFTTIVYVLMTGLRKCLKSEIFEYFVFLVILINASFIVAEALTLSAANVSNDLMFAIHFDLCSNHSCIVLYRFMRSFSLRYTQ